jgi:hypothetical protein
MVSQMMPRVVRTIYNVVDSNFLQNDELREYLNASTANRVVVAPFVAMEAYKGDTLKSIYNSMRILCKYPRQVVILKGASVVCGLQGTADADELRGQLIDVGQTYGFPDYCRHLRSAERGDTTIQKQLLAYGRAATEQMERMLIGATDIQTAIRGFAKEYTAAELKILRKGEDVTGPMMDKLVKTVMQLSAVLFATHPNVTNIPSADELPNTYIFRAALCMLVLAWQWIAVGGAGKVQRLERIRNDTVDVYLAAYATYFHGLLTHDQKLKQIYVEANFLLKLIVAARRRNDGR